MHRLANDGVFFQHEGRSASRRRAPARRKTGRSPADDDDIGCMTPEPGQNLRSRCSHVPRRLIQNDSRMSRMSSQKDRRLT